MSGEETDRISDIIIDEEGLPAAGPDAAHERRIAVFDLKDRNSFSVVGADSGPYVLTVSFKDGRLGLKTEGADGAEAAAHVVSLGAMRRLIRDYFTICDSYYAAIRDATPMQIEAIDMGRRAMHNEGADLLAKLLEGKYAFDFETARRLFTLVCALSHRG